MLHLFLFFGKMEEHADPKPTLPEALAIYLYNV